MEFAEVGEYTFTGRKKYVYPDGKVVIK